MNQLQKPLTVNLFFYDTETTGFNTKDPVGHDSQPYVLQKGFIYDEFNLETMEAKTIFMFNAIIGWPKCTHIPEGAAKVHGLSLEHVQQYGIEPMAAMKVFNQIIAKADMRVGHNESYDFEIMRHAYARVGAPTDVMTKFEGMNYHCTMKCWSSVFGGKWPKLVDAYRTAFGKEFEGAHDAFNDIRATRDIFYWMLTQPKVLESSNILSRLKAIAHAKRERNAA